VQQYWKVLADALLTMTGFTRCIPDAVRHNMESSGFIVFKEVTVRTKRKALFYGHRSEVSVT
jgi:hypothetical protein